MNRPMEHLTSDMLVAYAAGKLDLADAAAADRHLAGCEGCMSLAAEQTALWKALDAWEAPAVSTDFDRRLYRRIREEVSLSWWQRALETLRPLPLRQVVSLAAAGCLLLVASIFVQRPVQISPIKGSDQTVRVDQVESTLDDLDLLHQFGTPEKVETPHSEKM